MCQRMSLDSFKNVINKMCIYIQYLCIYRGFCIKQSKMVDMP